MKVSNKGKKLQKDGGDFVYSGNVIAFPKKNRKTDIKNRTIIDPCLSITTKDGRVLDKLGMSGDECCYILPPHVTFIRLSASMEAPEIEAGEVEPARLVPIRVILSESAAVTEIGMDVEESCTGRPEDESETHWVEPGRALYLARHAPEYVAMLSVKFASLDTLSG